MIRIGITGSLGKMGTRIREFVLADEDLGIGCLLEREGHPELGKKISGVEVSSSYEVLENCDVIIDFSFAGATSAVVEAAVKFKKPIVVGTTGLNEEQIAQIRKAAQSIPVVFSPNMSVGVNLIFNLVKKAAEKLKGYEIRITEAHHIHKKDAPSGTAKKIAQIIEQETKQPVNDVKSIREGEIIGDHEMIFESDVDIIKIGHSAKTRDIFVKGALVAAKWLAAKPAGFYDMQDVLGK